MRSVSSSVSELAKPSELVVVLSFETVDDIVERGFFRPPDRLIRALAADPATAKLMVVDPLRSYAGAVVRRLRGRPPARLPAGVDFARLSPRRLARHDPKDSRSLVRGYQRYDRMIEAAARRLGLADPTLISFNPLYSGFASSDWAKSSVYYGRDDWASHPSLQQRWEALEEAYVRMRDRARPTVAVSQVLLDRLAPTGPGLVLPNGVDASEWLEPTQPPEWFESLPRPRLLYLGTLDDRLDTEALESVAAAVPEGSVVLVGPTPDGSPVTSFEAPNVHRVPHQQREAVVAATCAADVCLLLHRRSPLTEAMSPLKLYEYLAGGCPVVATDLEPVRGISDRVLLVGDPADAPQVTRAAIEMGKATEESREEFVLANSWDQRHEVLLGFAATAARER